MKGPEMRDWYFCWQAGLIRQLTSADPPPQRHECVAFLPFGNLTITAQKPKDIFKTPETLADHLYQNRKKQGLFQREVAEAMNVALHSYIEWERGSCHPCYQGWPKVIGYLGYDPIESDGSFCANVDALTRSMGVSQKQLAQKLGIHRDTLRVWIDGNFHKSDARSRKAKEILSSLLS